MATYTKETALYDTGAIANDISEAGETASKYITAVDQNGIKVHAENNVNVNYSLINAEGMEVFQGDTAADSVSVAKFGVVTRVGTDENANIIITEDSISGVGENGKEFFRFANSDATLTTNLTKTVFHRSSSPSKFPHTSASSLGCTLPSTPDSGSTITVRFRLEKAFSGVEFFEITFTQGTSASKSIAITYGGTSYTLYAQYNGNATFQNIYGTPSMSALRSIECTITYSVSTTAPSFEIGEDVVAMGGFAYAEGQSVTASGNYSHAEGNSTTASGNYSHAEGKSTTASGVFSHTEGSGTTASGHYSHAEGLNTQAKGNYCHAEGSYTQAGQKEGDIQHNNAHAEGDHTTASGAFSHAEGIYSTASKDASHAEGYYTTASGNYSHAEGKNTTASGDVSHAEGDHTTASGNYSHAEGSHTTASGNYSHAEGINSTASGNYSHAEGSNSTAYGSYSHAGGFNSIANGVYQTVIGKCNVADTTSLFIIGNGAGTTLRSNALTVDGSGNVDIASGASYKINGTSLIDIFYPIGSYYETSDTTFDPNTAWGGTWSLETEGLVHIGAGATYTVGNTGGNKDAIVPYHNHTLTNPTVKTPALTVDNSHAGEYIGSASAISSLNRQLGSVGSSGGDYNYLRVAHTGASLTRSSPSISAGKTCTVTGGSIGYAGTDGNTADANMQPYIVVNRWHRTA